MSQGSKPIEILSISLSSFEMFEVLYFARNILKSGYSCTIEGTIIHPLFQKEKGALEEILIDADSFKNKVQQANNN